MASSRRFRLFRRALRRVYERSARASRQGIRSQRARPQPRRTPVSQQAAVPAIGRRRSTNTAGSSRAGGFDRPSCTDEQDWFTALEFSYDMSVPNVAHLEPQRGGCCTVMPYFVGDLLELPLTTIQDYSLFHILGDYSITLWKKQIDLILEQNGLVSLLAHPDYLIEKRAQAMYRELLEHLSHLREQKKLWMALPGEVDAVVAESKPDGHGPGRRFVAHRGRRERSRTRRLRHASGRSACVRAGSGVVNTVPEARALCRLQPGGDRGQRADPARADRPVQEQRTASHHILIPFITLALIYQGRDSIFASIRSDRLGGLAVILSGVGLALSAKLVGHGGISLTPGRRRARSHVDWRIPAVLGS